jgi:replicative DNA helicase
MNDHTPPQDVTAEQSLLGGVMLTPQVFTEVIQTGITGDDFYRPQHQTIWDAITSLAGNGDPYDPVSVADELQRRGVLARMQGGAVYLHDLTSAVPTGANAGYYARIVIGKAAQRRLIEAGTRIVQLGYEPAGASSEDLITAAQGHVMALHTPGGDQTWAHISAVMDDVMDAADPATDHPAGITWGWADVDEDVRPLMPGQFAVAMAWSGVGKALALNTPIPTPSGWTAMGDLSSGDIVLGDDGQPTRVVSCTDVQFGRDCYEVEFSDGAVIVADAEHRWVTDDLKSRKSDWGIRSRGTSGEDRVHVPRVRTTAEIAGTLLVHVGKSAKLNHSVKTCAPVELPEADLPVDPYCLGAWLGDGNSHTAQITSADPEVIAEFERAGFRVKPGGDTGGQARTYSIAGGLRVALRRLGLLGAGLKHIPPQYLRASVAQRRDLMAGLLDTDGYARPGGLVQFAVTSRRLAEGFRELISSLGYRSRMTFKRVNGRKEETSTAYVVTFTPCDKVFKLPRKLARQSVNDGSYTNHRMITDVRPVASVPVRCIQVDNPGHMYLAGETFIPTHNTIFVGNVAYSAAILQGAPTLVHALEMSNQEMGTRMAAAACGIDLERFAKRALTPKDWDDLARVRKYIDDAPLIVDDCETLNLAKLAASIRRHRPQLVIVDQIPIMVPNDPRAPREQQVASLAYGLKRLARSEGVAILACAQLNADGLKRVEKKPSVHDSRESKAIVHAADLAILLHDPTFGEQENVRKGEIDVIIGKQRAGKKDITIPLANQAHYGRFRDLAR